MVENFDRYGTMFMETKTLQQVCINNHHSTVYWLYFYWILKYVEFELKSDNHISFMNKKILSSQEPGNKNNFLDPDT